MLEVVIFGVFDRELGRSSIVTCFFFVTSLTSASVSEAFIKQRLFFCFIFISNSIFSVVNGRRFINSLQLNINEKYFYFFFLGYSCESLFVIACRSLRNEFDLQCVRVGGRSVDERKLKKLLFEVEKR